MMSATQAPATSARSKPMSTGRARLGLGQDAQRRLGDDAKLAFRTADQAQQVIARRIEMRAADLDTVPSISTI
jgi:hypothetical protein